MGYAIFVHGGAGAIHPDDDEARATSGCRAAADAGFRVLERGGCALDAVVAAAVVLEDDPVFNAGTGSCLTSEGQVEMDAGVMDGRTLRLGAVGAVRGVKNPILLARAVMERTPHVLLCGEGAERLADHLGIPRVPDESLVTPRARARWDRERAKRGTAPSLGTIGAVACDQEGNVAAATSTGGISFKLPGRVGDTPIAGAGTYADHLGGAISATGHGESIIRVALAKLASEALRNGATPEAAARQAIVELDRVKGEGGLILVDPHGRLAQAFNTARMARAWRSSDGSQGEAFGR